MIAAVGIKRDHSSRSHYDPWKPARQCNSASTCQILKVFVNPISWVMLCSNVCWSYVVVEGVNSRLTQDSWVDSASRFCHTRFCSQLVSRKDEMFPLVTRFMQSSVWFRSGLVTHFMWSVRACRLSSQKQLSKMSKKRKKFVQREDNLMRDERIHVWA